MKTANSLRPIASGARIAIRSSDILSTPTTIILKLSVLPLINVVYMVTMSDGGGFAVAMAAAVQSGALAALSSAAAVNTGDRNAGTAAFVVLGSAPRLAVGAGRVMVPTAFGIAAAWVSFLLAYAGEVLLGHDPSVSALSFLSGGLLTVTTASASAACFGWALGALGVRLRDPYLLSNLGAGALLLLTGVVAPSQALPTWLGAASDALPLTHAVRATRVLAAHRVGDFAVALGFEAGVGAVWLACGLLAGAWAERSALASGGLERY
jgi:ABC-2 type transport system permease protein